MKKNRKEYKWQVLGQWEINKGTPEEIEEYDTEIAATIKAVEFASSGRDTYYVARVVKKVSPKLAEINVDVEEI